MMKSRLRVLGLSMALAGTASLTCAAARPENESGQFLDGQISIGDGAACKNETDGINGSRLNFTEELLWRFPWQPAMGEVELAIRHMSNAGLKKPNKGQDFVTVVYAF
jgi:hypothetical protein